MFWLVGYNMAYGIPEGGFIGSPIPWSDASALILAIQMVLTGFSRWFSVQLHVRLYLEH